MLPYDGMTRIRFEGYLSPDARLHPSERSDSHTPGTPSMVSKYRKYEIIASTCWPGGSSRPFLAANVQCIGLMTVGSG